MGRNIWFHSKDKHPYHQIHPELTVIKIGAQTE